MSKIRKYLLGAAVVLFVTGSALCVVELVLKTPPAVLGPYSGPFGGLEIALSVLCLILAIDPDRIQTALLSRFTPPPAQTPPPAPPEGPKPNV